MALSKQKAEAIIEIVGKENLTVIAKQIDAGFAKATGSVKDFDGATEDASTRMATLATGVSSVINIAQQAAGAMRAVGDTMKGVATQQAVTRQFDRMGLSLERIRDAAHGTIADGALKRWSIQLAQAGRSTADIEQLVSLSAKLAASGLGAAKGITTTADALEALTDSVIGASDSDLEKFGVLFDMPAATKKLAAEMKLLGDDVDKTVESQAVFNFITGEMAAKVSDVKVEGLATDIQKVETALTNFSDAAKIGFIESLQQWPAILDDIGRGFRYVSESMSFFVVGTDASAAAMETANKHLKAQGVALEKIPELLLTAADKTALLANEQATAAEKADILARSYRAVAESARELQRLAFRETTDEDREFFTKGAAPGPLGLQKMVKTPTRRRGGGRTRDDFVAATGGVRGMPGSFTGSFEDIKKDALDAGKKMAADQKEYQRTLADTRQALEDVAAAQQAAFLEKDERQKHALGELADAQHGVAMGAYDMAAAMAGGMNTTAAAVVSAGDIVLGQYSAITDQMAAMEAAGISSSTALVASAPSMISATGMVAASFIKDEQAKAAVMAAVEGAASIASFAGQDYYGGTMHAAASVAYIAAAAMSGSGGPATAGAGAGGAARSGRAVAPNVGPQQTQQGGGTYNVNITMPGATVIGSNSRKVGRELQGIINSAASFMPV